MLGIKLNPRALGPLILWCNISWHRGTPGMWVCVCACLLSLPYLILCCSCSFIRKKQLKRKKIRYIVQHSLTIFSSSFLTNIKNNMRWRHYNIETIFFSRWWSGLKRQGYSIKVICLWNNIEDDQCWLFT